MKKLILFIVLMSLSYLSFSQTSVNGDTIFVVNSTTLEYGQDVYWVLLEDTVLSSFDNYLLVGQANSQLASSAEDLYSLDPTVGQNYGSMQILFSGKFKLNDFVIEIDNYRAPMRDVYGNLFIKLKN